MKFLRFGQPGQERPGVLDEAGVIKDLSGVIADLRGDVLGSIGELKTQDIAGLPAVTEPQPRIGACVTGVSKVIGIGLNFIDHATETNSPVPDEPIVFLKAASSVSGPYDDVIMPPGTTKLDWEVELGVVIGKRASYVSEADAPEYIAGYCIVHDVSERAFQLETGGQWTKGKSADTFAPIGPWLVTPDEVGDPQNLKMWTDVDGDRRQNGSSKTMIFGVNHLVSYVSQYMSLLPGDIISTGTPPGVGLGAVPPDFLRPGQVVELGIEKLGVQRQKIASYNG